jgi:hypothetical protein
LCTRGDIITRADLAGEHEPASRAEASRDAVDELVVVSSGRDAEIVELRHPIAALPAARRAALCVEWSGERSLDDAVEIETAIDRAIDRKPAQPRR